MAAIVLAFIVKCDGAVMVISNAVPHMIAILGAGSFIFERRSLFPSCGASTDNG